MPKPILAALLIFLTTSCTLGPDYRRPTIETPSAWRQEGREAREAVNTLWWEQFNDPVLNGLIETALKENKDIQFAAFRIEEYLGRYGLVRSTLFPQVNAAAFGQQKRVTEYSNPPWPSTADNPYSDYQALLSASWEIDLWGKFRRASEAARAELLGTEEARRAVILTVVTAVAAAYTDLRDLDKQLDIAQRTAQSRGNAFDLFKLRFDRGLISELEVKQIESEVQATLATVASLQKIIVLQENALSLLLGRNPGPILRGKTVDDLILPAVPAGLPSQLLERRPDILRAEQDLIAANARIGVARALYFPSISLTGFLGLESKDLSLLFSGAARIWNYAAVGTLPVFSAGGIAGTVQATEALQQQALTRYQQTIQNAFREVEDALIDQAKSREQLIFQKKQIEALRDSFNLARLRYENGYTSFLDVLDAERGLFNAELSYTQTQGLLFRALINLYKAMGGGWVVEADKLTGVDQTRLKSSEVNGP
jgi:multidrug efflux system outer membrane protein